MTGPTIIELDEHIAMIRENINELVEQEAAYFGVRQTGSRSKSRNSPADSNSGPRIKLSVNILAGFSNSGPRIKLSVNILAGSRVLSAVGACPLHDGVL